MSTSDLIFLEIIPNRGEPSAILPHLGSAPRLNSWSFIIFSLDALSHIIRQHHINFDCYAENAQLYTPLDGDQTSNFKYYALYVIQVSWVLGISVFIPES